MAKGKITDNVLRAKVRKAFKRDIDLRPGDLINVPGRGAAQFVQTGTMGSYPAAITVLYRPLGKESKLKPMELPENVYVGNQAYRVQFREYTQSEMKSPSYWWQN